MIPPELALPERVGSLAEVSVCLQRAAHACGLLSNQHELLAHSYALRLSLLQDLFLRLLPLPPPVATLAAAAADGLAGAAAAAAAHAAASTPSAIFWRRATAEASFDSQLHALTHTMPCMP